MDKQAATTLAQMGVEQQNTLAKMAAQQGMTLDQMAAQSGYDINKLKVQTAAAMDVAQIEASYKNLTQGSAAATSIMGKMQGSLDALMANTNLQGEANRAVRDQMAADIKANAVDALNLVGALAGNVDLTNYINQVLP